MLGLPAKYAIALMVASSGAQWLLSQSLFLVRIDGVESHGVPDDNDVIARLGYSSLGILLVVVLLIIALGNSVWMGWFRKLSNTMPGDGTNSAVISAACHLGDGGMSGSAYGSVMWGDVDDGSGAGRAAGHCSFSAGWVMHPVEGKAYA